MKTVLKTLPFLFCALGVLALAGQADAGTLYGATSSGHGELYILNPATGGPLQDIGPLNDVTGLNYSVTGLAFDPITGVLYGSTGGVTGTKLLTINPATASVSVVGSFSAGTATMTDLAFNQAGNLYGISSSGGAKLYSINKGTGAATLIGASAVSFTEGGGLAISSGGVFYASPIPGEYGTYNSTTGAYTHIATPASPVGSGGSYAALAFDGATLYGDNLKPGTGGGATHLVTIDPTTGNVTDIGPSVTHLDAIAFSVPEPATTALVGFAILAGLVFRRRGS
jgi:PEP-CTERM motif-containing protein